MRRLSQNSDSLREKKEKIMNKILDKIDIELSAISTASSFSTDATVCKNVGALADTFNLLDSWLPDENQSPAKN
jgi:hypothetical protein